MEQENRTSLVEAIRPSLPEGSLIRSESFRDQETMVVSGEKLIEVMTVLRDAFSYKYLIDLTALDFFPAQPRFQVVYHLWSHSKTPGLLRVKVEVPGESPSVPSVAGIWSTADWHERECRDLFGITFNGHPDMRPLLLTDDWEGHPLRKDYPVEGY